MKFHKKLVIVVAILCAGASIADEGKMSSAPRWSLSAPVAVGEKPYVTPSDVIPDHAAFTVSAKFRLAPWNDKARVWIDLFSQRTAQTGWALSAQYAPGSGNKLFFEANGVSYALCGFGLRDAGVHEWTVTVRGGVVVVYRDGAICGRALTTIVPNLEPIQVGCPQTGRGALAPIAGSELLEMRVWDGSEVYRARGETLEFAGGKKGGKGWMIDVPANAQDESLPGLLYMGDSISHGYSGPLKERLGKTARLYHWSKFFWGVSAETNLIAQATAACLPVKMIVFNNGLHSLHSYWQKASDDEVRQVYRDAVRAFRQAAPQAMLVYLNTTPQTGRKGTSGKVETLGDLNYMVLRLNRLSAEVMSEEKVPTIDAYAMLVGRLDLAVGDGCHWGHDAYVLLAEAIAAKFVECTTDRN